jgi:hypothetical protein
VSASKPVNVPQRVRLDGTLTVATTYPAGTKLESLCPECLAVAGKTIEDLWCWLCLVERNEWIRVVWRRQR